MIDLVLVRMLQLILLHSSFVQTSQVFSLCLFCSCTDLLCSFGGCTDGKCNEVWGHVLVWDFIEPWRDHYIRSSPCAAHAKAEPGRCEFHVLLLKQPSPVHHGFYLFLLLMRSYTNQTFKRPVGSSADASTLFCIGPFVSILFMFVCVFWIFWWVLVVRIFYLSFKTLLLFLLFSGFTV